MPTSLAINTELAAATGSAVMWQHNTMYVQAGRYVAFDGRGVLEAFAAASAACCAESSGCDEKKTRFNFSPACMSPRQALCNKPLLAYWYGNKLFWIMKSVRSIAKATAGITIKMS